MTDELAVEATGLEKSYRAVKVMPTWLHGFAENQPVTPVIETLRGLLLGTPVGTSPWQALAWCGAILVASVALAGVLFRRRTA